MKRAIAIICLFALITGCSVLMNPRVMLSKDNAEEVYKETKIETDPYKKTTCIKSPSYITNTPTARGDDFDIILRSYENKFFRIYVRYTGTSWYYFHEAYDINDNKVDFEKIDTQTGVGFDCPPTLGACVSEIFAITVDEAYLQNCVQDGIDINVVGKRAAVIVKVPAYYVEGFLKKCHELQQ